MSRIVGLAVSAAVLATSFAQPAVAAGPDKAPAASSRSLDCARRYNEAMHMERTMEAMMTNLMPAMMAQFEGDDDDKAELKQVLIEAMAESAVEMTPAMLEALAPVMARSFSEAELCGLADFYESEIGQAVVAKMPAYTAAASEPMAKFVPRMQADMLARFCRKWDCEGRAAKRPTRSAS